MSYPENEEFEKIIDGMILATRRGDFQWRSVNPSTYVWDGVSRAAAPARLTLQRVSQKSEYEIGGLKMPSTTTYFILQVSEITPQGVPEVRLNISGAGEEALNTKLRELYKLILSGITEKGLQFLKDILPNPQTK